MYDELEMAHITKSLEEKLTISGETDPKSLKEPDAGSDKKPNQEESKVEEIKEEKQDKETNEIDDAKEIKETKVLKETD